MDVMRKDVEAVFVVAKWAAAGLIYRYGIIDITK